MTKGLWAQGPSLLIRDRVSIRIDTVYFMELIVQFLNSVVRW